MRTECRHYDSRTYGSGEVVQKCRLDLAPEAPWRCPEDCWAFELRRMDVGWNYGSLGAAAKSPEAPVSTPTGDDVAALLDAAEDIVNAAGPAALAEFEKSGKKKSGKWRRKKRK